MRIKRVTKEELVKARILVNAVTNGNVRFDRIDPQYYRGNVREWVVTLKVNDRKGIGVSYSRSGKRLVNIPCWHVWGLFISALPQSAQVYSVVDHAGTLRWQSAGSLFKWFDNLHGRVDGRLVLHSQMCECNNLPDEDMERMQNAMLKHAGKDYLY